MPSLPTAELDLWFLLTEDGTKYIDLAQCFSLTNRVFVRQGMQYVVKDVQWFSTDTATLIISRLPNSWPCVNSLVKGYSEWKQQQDSRIQESGLQSTVARYRDFKIHMDPGHVTAGVAGNLLPIGYTITSGASATEMYEWDMSQFVIPNDGGPGVSAEYFGHVLGDDVPTSKALIHAYAENRARPQTVDPNLVDVSPDHTLYGSMYDVGDDSGEIITNVQDNNHVPPYLIDEDTAVEFYPGGANQGGVVYTNFLSSSSGGSSLSRSFGPGFIAAHGLISVATDFLTTGSGFLRVSLVPGDNRGCMARPMGDVN